MRRLALALSFSVGFLSLSQEIIWVRLVSHGYGGRPFAFSWVLSAFLVGIALGAWIGRCVCARTVDIRRDTGVVMMAAAFVDCAALLVAPFVLYPAMLPMGMVFLLVALCAAGKAVVFPLVHHMGTAVSGPGVGRSVSAVYLANVLGSTLGPVATGFFLLDVLTATQIFLLIIALTLAIGIVVTYGSVWQTASARLAAACALGLMAVMVFAHRERDIITLTSLRFNGGEVETVLQGRHGVIHTVTDTDGGGLITLGGNVYDGRISVDLQRNANELDRAYMMALMHPAPRRVMVVGMSSGAWTQVIAGFPGVEHIDVVEVNPRYLELMAASPEVGSVLRDPRVSIHIDDGRRWLRAHPAQRYDLIFQNTTFHWRANTSLLLSREYFGELRTHLNPGGVLTVNTTHSTDVFYTALAVFRHVEKYKHFAYMSDQPIRPRPDGEAVLRSCTVDGHLAFTESSFHGGIASQMLAWPVQGARQYLRTADPDGSGEVITDLNPVNEYRHGLPHPLPILRGLLPVRPRETS